LGTPQEIIYPNCEVFCSASRRNDRRIVNYVTVIATQKLGKRQSKVGKLFPVGCLNHDYWIAVTQTVINALG
ncbi:MAG: hypothetical protein BECKG1743E_GA0114224_104055, partial [Candidatus Kentron sp. G]